MTNQAGFAAELLKRSATGYAGTAANLLLEKQPELRKQAGAFATWKSHLTQRTLELAAALEVGEPRLFTERLVWSRKTFAARDQDDKLLRQSTRCLRESLAGSLPENAAAVCTDYLDAAIDVVEGPLPEPDESELDPAKSSDKLALLYLQAALEGNSTEAIQQLEASLSNGQTPASLYLDVLLPAQREIGRLWHKDEVSVAEEHLVSATTARAMAILAHNAPRKAINNKTVAAACVPSNIHDLGVRALSDLFHLSGWRAIYLGADVPYHDLPGALTYLEADLLLLSATLSTHIAAAHDVVTIIREECARPVKILVGGAAFLDAPEVWRQTGADAFAADANEALRIGAQLVGLESAD